MLNILGQTLLKGTAVVAITPTPTPTPPLEFYSTNDVTNLIYSGLGTSANRIVGYVGGIGNDTIHELVFIVNTSGTLYYSITASSESGFDFGLIFKGATQLASVSGSQNSTGTTSVLIGDFISVKYTRDESGASGLDRVTMDYLYIL